MRDEEAGKQHIENDIVLLEKVSPPTIAVLYEELSTDLALAGQLLFEGCTTSVLIPNGFYYKVETAVSGDLSNVIVNEWFEIPLY